MHCSFGEGNQENGVAMCCMPSLRAAAQDFKNIITTLQKCSQWPSVRRESTMQENTDKQLNEELFYKKK